ncbi:MAG TPA: hypothetical protein VH253_17465 [Phycisphaerae bacterium]|nr:hypothetical protein [Phycisphaerae bacterium]
MRHVPRTFLPLLLISTVLPAFGQANPAVTPADKQLADAFAAAVAAHDVSAANACINGDALADRCTTGFAADPEFTTGFKKGLSQNLSNFTGPLVTKLPEGATYTLLRVRRRNNQVSALFRLHMPTGAINYHDWIIENDSAGKPRFVDLYDATKGENISATIHRLFVAAAIADDKTSNATLSAREKELVDALPKTQQMYEKISAGDAVGALAIRDALPASVQQIKWVRVGRVLASTGEGVPPDVSQDAMDDFQKAYPNDPAIDLIGIDFWWSRKDFARIYQAVDHLETYTGGDPYLDFLRGNAYINDDKHPDAAAAKAAYQKAADADPPVEDAYWALITLALKEQDFDRTAQLLTDVQKRCNVRIADLTQNKLYADFVKSPAYVKWHAAQQAGNP